MLEAGIWKMFGPKRFFLIFFLFYENLFLVLTFNNSWDILLVRKINKVAKVEREESPFLNHGLAKSVI
jgi:hypothetical protein